MLTLQTIKIKWMLALYIYIYVAKFCYSLSGFLVAEWHVDYCKLTFV